MDGGWFYAVAAGRRTGIFRSLSDAQSQVHGFSGSKWKKFGSRRQAEEYLLRNGIPVQLPRQEQSPLPPQPPLSSLNQFDYLTGSGSTQDPEFYALYLGKFSGICSSRETVDEFVRKSPRTSVTKCATFAHAEECLGSFGMMVDPHGRLNPDGSWTWVAYRRGRSMYTVPDPEEPDSLVALCDGSALNNGQYNAHAAFACIFPHN